MSAVKSQGNRRRRIGPLEQVVLPESVVEIPGSISDIPESVVDIPGSGLDVADMIIDESSKRMDLFSEVPFTEFLLKLIGIRTNNQSSVAARKVAKIVLFIATIIEISFVIFMMTRLNFKHLLIELFFLFLPISTIINVAAIQVILRNGTFIDSMDRVLQSLDTKRKKWLPIIDFMSFMFMVSLTVIGIASFLHHNLTNGPYDSMAMYFGIQTIFNCSGNVTYKHLSGDESSDTLIIIVFMLFTAYHSLAQVITVLIYIQFKLLLALNAYDVLMKQQTRHIRNRVMADGLMTVEEHGMMIADRNKCVFWINSCLGRISMGLLSLLTLEVLVITMFNQVSNYPFSIPLFVSSILPWTLLGVVTITAALYLPAKEFEYIQKYVWMIQSVHPTAGQTTLQVPKAANEVVINKFLLLNWAKAMAPFVIIIFTRIAKVDTDLCSDN